MVAGESEVLLSEFLFFCILHIVAAGIKSHIFIFLPQTFFIFPKQLKTRI